jgi:hypothetical protein
MREYAAKFQGLLSIILSSPTSIVRLQPKTVGAPAQPSCLVKSESRLKAGVCGFESRHGWEYVVAMIAPTSAPTLVPPPRKMPEVAEGNMQRWWMGACPDHAAALPDRKLRKHWLRMARSFQRDADLLGTSRSMIDDSRRLLASLQADRLVLGNVDGHLLASSRARIDDSRRLLARLTVEIPTGPMQPAAADDGLQLDGNSATLTVHVFQEGSRFGWTLNTPRAEVLGRGIAETEFQARVDALQSGMTYVDRAKGRSSPGDSNLH